MSTASSDDYFVADASPLMVTVEASAPAVSRNAHLPSVVVLMGAFVGLALIAMGSLREGLIGLTVSLALASVLRLLLPGAAAEWLSSRTRIIDSGLMAALAGSLGAVTLLLFK